MQLGKLDNEVIFKKAFTDKFVFQSFEEQVEYDQSRLQYIGAREMVNTAIEDGMLKGMAIAEAKAEKEKEQIILNFYKLGFPTESIARAVNKSIEEVAQILAKHQ